MPPIQRNKPAWRQIADHFKTEILEGRLSQGDQLPAVREVAADWAVSQGTAQQALAHLHRAERLVRTDPSGTYVAAPRATLGPQQRMALRESPASEVVTVTFAGPVTAPEYIVPMFGLQDGPPDHPVIRREEVTRGADGSPVRLSVTWVSPKYFSRVPELTLPVPLPDPKGAAHLIAERSGIDPGTLTGGIAFECRLAKDDGREMPALDLLESWAYVLAVVSGWRHEGELLEYTESVLRPNRVIEADIEP